MAQMFRGLIILLAISSLAACSNSGSEAESGSQLPLINPVVTNDPPPPPEPDPVPQKVDITFSWDIPTERENGNELPLSEIGGYHLLYRSDPGEDYGIMLLEDQMMAEVTLTDLDPGEYEFAIAVFDSNGLYSSFTAPMLVTLN